MLSKTSYTVLFADLKILGGQEDALYEAQFGDHLK